MWVIDIRYWLNESQDEPAVPQLAKKVERLKEIIVFASSVASLVPVVTFPKCDRRPGRKPCKGRLDVEMEFTGYVRYVVMRELSAVAKDLFWNVTMDDFEEEIH